MRLATLLLLSATAAVAQAPPGTPKPSTGAPGDKAGRNDPFGTQGAKAEQTRSQAEAVAHERKPIVAKITVKGNEHTAEAIVRRAMVLKEGDELDDQAVHVARIRLLQLGAFSDAQVEVTKESREGFVDIAVTVVERNPYFITDVMYGSTPLTDFFGGIGVADANFAGLGLGLSVQALYGTNWQRALRVSLYEPSFRLFDETFVAGIGELLERGVENACGNPDCLSAGSRLRYTRSRTDFNVGVRDATFGRFLFGYRIEVLDSYHQGPAGTGMPYILPGHSNISALTFEFDRDSRDETFLPTHGSRIQAFLTLSSRAIGSDYEYSRYLLQLEQWFPQGGGRALRLDAVGGVVQGDAPFFDRFYVADWSYFNVGTATARALELNLSPDPRYDDILAVLGAEYDFPLWRHEIFHIKRAYLALGARFVYSEQTPGAGRTPLSSSPFSGDIAFRFDTPIGLVNFSVAFLADSLLKHIL
ncbi:MAG: BamA/TamA family outer membrane protein [Myxococcales bacterium]